MSASTTDRKVYVAGEEGSPLSSVSGKPVRIEEIRTGYNKDNLWTDPDFKPVLESIGPLSGDTARGAEELKNDPYKDPTTWKWVRPYDYCKLKGVDRPQFAVAQDGLSAKKCSEYDVSQGTCLGDCWYVCSVQALTTKPAMLDWVIPEGNFTGFDDDKYCGAFHFRFYIVSDDKWVDIVVDDLLPMRSDKQLAFADVTSNIKSGYAEFWVALLEKAYAKLHGCYKAIEGGCASQALENFTGGFAEIFELAEEDTRNVGGEGSALLADQYETIRRLLLRYIKSDVFLGADTFGETRVQLDDQLQAGYGDEGLGLHGSHAYSIQDVQEVNLKEGESKKVLVKLKNPWGSGEWKGDYSDADDANWAKMERDLRVRSEYDSTDVNEGAFWMDLHDVVRYFQQLEICHFGLTDGTQLARAKGVWPAALQDMPPVADTRDLLRFTAYKFEVLQGEAAFKYSAESGGKAIVCYSVAIEGYNSLANPPITCYADLYKVDDDEQTLEEVVYENKIRSTRSVGRGASSWTFVDPGTYILLPRLYVGYVGEEKTPPPEFAGKDIGFCVRVFTENETTIEPWTEEPVSID